MYMYVSSVCYVGDKLMYIFLTNRGTMLNNVSRERWMVEFIISHIFEITREADYTP